MPSKRDECFPWLWDYTAPTEFLSIPKPIGIHNQTQMVADDHEVAFAAQGLETITEHIKVKISHFKVRAVLG